ncbi:MAG: protein-L-isoaspartate O-methyltransferase [Alphaproteobacteria bacterium]|jgi:protein-L-isoaspartate(D-aspartate) O-methyltransferase
MNDVQFETARRMMVDCQIRPTKVTDERVLEAFATVPREMFVSKQQRSIAYVDEDLSLNCGRWLMEPMVQARLVQALDVRMSDHVLIIGSATGYGTAIMAQLASSVISIETRAQLVEKSQETLVSIGADNAAVIKSRLCDGYNTEGPYDRILIEGAVAHMPEKLLEQLTPKGRLVAVWRPADVPVGVASLWCRAGDGFARTPLFDAQTPVLEEFRAKQEFVF